MFPDWYKPYGFNYQGEGWLAVILGGFAVGTYSYMNDIKEQKGRKTRKQYPILLTPPTQLTGRGGAP